jgi:hypothetical protein
VDAQRDMAIRLLCPQMLPSITQKFVGFQPSFDPMPLISTEGNQSTFFATREAHEYWKTTGRLCNHGIVWFG